MNNYRNYKGYFTALVTPFTKDGAIDYESFIKIVKRQEESGIHGIVVCGSTGEAGSLTLEEKIKLLKLARENYDDHIIFGASAHDHYKVIELANTATKNGADCLLIAPPAYVKPSQRALIDYYTKIHNATSLPIILYNIPGRTAVDISDDTITTLAGLKMVIGLKDATGDLNRPSNLIMKLKKEYGSEFEFSLLSGDDITTPAYMAQGGHGAISVTSNLLPRHCVSMINFWISSDHYMDMFKTHRDILAPIHPVLFVESNPVPIKYALSKLGLCEEHVRPPLCNLSAESKKIIDSIMNNMDIKP